MCSDLQFCWTARTTNKSQHPIASRVNMKSGYSKPKLNSCKGLRLTFSTRVCVIFSYLHYQSHNPHQVHQFHPYKYLLMTSLFSSSLLHLLQEDIEIVLTLHKNRKPPYCSLHFCYIKKCICQLWFLRYMSQDICFKKHDSWTLILFYFQDGDLKKKGRNEMVRNILLSMYDTGWSRDIVSQVSGLLIHLTRPQPWGLSFHQISLSLLLQMVSPIVE